MDSPTNRSSTQQLWLRKKYFSFEVTCGALLVPDGKHYQVTKTRHRYRMIFPSGTNVRGSISTPPGTKEGGNTTRCQCLAFGTGWCCHPVLKDPWIFSCTSKEALVPGHFGLVPLRWTDGLFSSSAFFLLSNAKCYSWGYTARCIYSPFHSNISSFSFR